MKPKKAHYITRARFHLDSAAKKVLMEVITGDDKRLVLVMSGQTLLELGQLIQDLETKAPEIREWKSTPRSLH